MTLLEGQKIAEATCLLLESAAERIAVAGSIRRRRPTCNDVDLVVIPKIVEHRDLLGNVESSENLVRTLLADYVRSNSTKARWASGAIPKLDAQNLIIQGAKCQLDVWIASPATWATRLLTRTGSMQHNIWIATRATARRGHFKPYDGLWLPGGGLFQPESEEAFYEALGLPFIEPENRERMQLMRLETELACQ